MIIDYLEKWSQSFRDMVKKLLIVAIGLSINVSAFGVKAAEPDPVSSVLLPRLASRDAKAGEDRNGGGLQDGFVLRGVDGEVNGPDANGKLVFKFSVDVNDEKGVVKTGTNLELLPSATLEKIMADINERSAADYRLWGRVTRYKGKNFIFPSYFLPLGKLQQPAQVSQTQESPPQEGASPNESVGGRPAEVPSMKEREPERDINEPNDVLNIPQEIVEKLRTRRIAQPAISRTGETEDVNAVEQKAGVAEGRERKGELEKEREFKQDAILADRTALLVKQDDGRFVFVLDALGLNTPEVSLRVLPCEALELTEQRQSAEPEPVPFKIAGIMTKYKGKYYLLPQKATRVYSYGNLGG